MSTKFEWTPEAQDAFESLKLKLTSTPILAFPCLKEPFILYTDASQFATGAVMNNSNRLHNSASILL